MTDLERKIKEYADAYYRGEELISDSEYDVLLVQLRKENPQSQFLKKEILGDNLKGVSKKYKLPITMGSLAKCNNDEEMQEWWNKHPHDNLVCELKLDGSSQCISYKNGRFEKSYNRGNGVYGEDSSENMKKVRGVPLELQDKDFTGEIRGEVVMYRSVFETYFKDTGKKNPRNATAGILNRLDGENCDKLQFIAYEVFDHNNQVDTEEVKKLQFLATNQFTLPVYVVNPTLQELIEWKNSIRNDSELPCDGLVIKQNKVDKKDLSRLVPQNNVAFKPNLEIAVSTVLDIVWQLQGSVLSPVVILKPVELEGTTVSKASVANVNKMNELGIYKGATVVVSKHGMIIPHVDKVLEPKQNAFEIPTSCPVCKSQIVVNDSGFPECLNPDCSRKLAHKYLRMFNVLDIKGAGDVFINRLEEEGVTFVEFFKKIDSSSKDILNEYAGGVNGEKVFIQLNNVRKTPITPSKFLALFDYRSLSEKQFEKLGNKELQDILALDKNTLMNIKGIGPEIANAMYDFFNSSCKEILEIQKYFNIQIKEKTTDSNKPTVCFTGTCSSFSRKELKNLSTSKYTVVDSVTKDLSILVCEDPMSGSSKLKKATSLGITLMSYDDFLKTLGIEYVQL